MNNNNGVSGTAVLVTVCVVFVTTVVATTLLAIFASNGDGTITLLIAQLAPTITAVATLLRLEQTRKEVNTALNGQMDEKIKANVSETLERHGVPVVPEQKRR